MALRDQIERLGNSLLGLGARRLIALAVVGLTVFAAVAFGSYYLSRPQYEMLYVGLTQQDASRMGAALRDAGIPFDIAADGTRVMVPYGETARARMLLAEKGLPTSASSGYELFDKLGPVGLTSFMQDITRVRALEGEIGRSIQTMRGIKAARVHIVLPDLGSFRRARQVPSASVIVNTENGDRPPAAGIQHLVAAAVPGLAVEQVTVLSTDGTVLAAGGENVDASPGKMADLEKTVTAELQENIRKTLVPYLGPNNFEVSVAARLNTDKRQTNETIFDPDSRTERSIRSVKETGRTENNGSRATVTVEQNVPGEATGATPGENSKSQKDRKEELTNYELNSKVVSTISSGYRIDGMTVAVVVNRKQILSALGANATQEAVDAQLKQLQTVVETAVGVDEKRGDRVSVTALDFMSDGSAFPPVPEPGFIEILMRQAGSFINAAAIIVATLLLILLGLRPAIQAIMAEAPPEPTPVALEREAQPAAIAPAREPAAPLPDITGPSTQARLEEVVDNFEAEAATLLKQWMKA